MISNVTTLKAKVWAANDVFWKMLIMLSCCRHVHHVHHVYSELCSMLSCCKHFQYVKYVQCYHVAGMFIQAGMVSPLLAKMFSKDISITSSVAGRRYHKFETLMLVDFSKYKRLQGQWCLPRINSRRSGNFRKTWGQQKFQGSFSAYQI